MNATVLVSMGNSAFEDSNGAELARILRKLADSIDGENYDTPNDWKLRDSNGNTVGRFMVSR